MHLSVLYGGSRYNKSLRDDVMNNLSFSLLAGTAVLGSIQVIGF